LTDLPIVRDIGSALQFVLQHLVERVEEADDECGPESVVFDEIEPVEIGRNLHTNLLPG
jgi:hypothetical protein